MDGLLRGWKEIEGYLRLTRKTILACGYPVHRQGRGGGWKRRVYALKSELQEWLARAESQCPRGGP